MQRYAANSEYMRFPHRGECINMHIENRVFPSVSAFGDFYAILSVKKWAFACQRKGLKR